MKIPHLKSEANFEVLFNDQQKTTLKKKVLLYPSLMRIYTKFITLGNPNESLLLIAGFKLSSTQHEVCFRNNAIQMIKRGLLFGHSYLQVDILPPRRPSEVP